MDVFRLVGALAAPTLCLFVSVMTPAAAEAAALASGLQEPTSSYDRGDPRLAAQLALHITNRRCDPMVLIHLEPNSDASAVLTELAAAGFQLTTHSTINPALVEGYLPLAAVHTAAAVAGVRALHAQQRPVKRAALLPVLPPVKQAAVFEKANIANALPSPILVIGPRREILYANPAAEQFFDTGAAILAKQNLADLLPFG